MEYAVCYASDDNYCAVMGTSICSLLENNKDLESLNIFILSNGLSEENKDKIEALCKGYGRDCYIYELAEELSNLDRLEKSWNITTYARLFIPEIVPLDVSKIFYIDADTLIVGSIREVFSTLNTSDKIIYGVLDRYNKDSISRLGLKEPIYINAGLTLMNLSRWRQEGISERMLTMVGQKKWKFPDQDIINVVLAGEIGILPMQYNMYMFSRILPYDQAVRLSYDGIENYYKQSDYEYARKNTAIIHFSGDLFNRPWQMNSRQTDHEKFDFYLQKTPWADEPYKKRKYAKKLSSTIYQMLTERVLWECWKRKNYKKFTDYYLLFNSFGKSIGDRLRRGYGNEG